MSLRFILIVHPSQTRSVKEQLDAFKLFDKRKGISSSAVTADHLDVPTLIQIFGQHQVVSPTLLSDLLQITHLSHPLLEKISRDTSSLQAYLTPDDTSESSNTSSLPRYLHTSNLLLFSSEPQSQIDYSSLARRYGVEGIAVRLGIQREDEMRKGRVKWLWPKGITTEHEFWTSMAQTVSLSGGKSKVLKWFWNPNKTMFSRGNWGEKARIAALPDVDGFTVVDLYAGIGYFTLPYLVAGAKEIFACEINPWSIEGLKKGADNLKIKYDVSSESSSNFVQHSRLHILTAYNHLCLAFFRNKAQHVSLGILPSPRLSPSFPTSCPKDQWTTPPSSGLWVAIRALKLAEHPGWGTLRVHEEVVVRSKVHNELEKWGKEISDLIERLLKDRWEEEEIMPIRTKISIEYIGKIKSMGPGIEHVVGDFKIANIDSG